MTTQTQVRVPPAESADFVKGINLTSATSLVVGSMIGSGIFIVAAEMARETGAAGWMMLAWVVAGVLTLAAALSYGELAAMMPRAAQAMRAVYGDALDDLWDRYVAGQEALFHAGGDLYAGLLAQVICPTLVLHGAKDPLIPGLHPEAIHRGIAGSRLYIFPDGKHNIHLRYADEFNALVLSFLTSPDRS